MDFVIIEFKNENRLYKSTNQFFFHFVIHNKPLVLQKLNE